MLKDKAGSPYSLNNPSDFLSSRSVERRLRQNIPLKEKDLPVNPVYVTAIRQAGAKVWYQSRWLNAVLMEADENTLQAVLKLTFVKGLENSGALANARREAAGGKISGGQSIVGKKTENRLPDRKKGQTHSDAKVSEAPLQYGPSADQVAMIGADRMHQQGYHGEGMLIAVFDGGFRDVDKLAHFTHLLAEDRLRSTYDFVNNETSVFEDNSHGAQVLGTMAGFLEGKLIGTAYKASYLLLRTEDVSSEYRIEEANWLMAAEYADSAGVDVINSSLGYSTFSDPAMDYTYADLNGHKALITRAAEFAASVGMLVVNSAGNEGNNAWRYITPPADADSILTIASVNKDQVRASSSSKGPTADGRIKPDLAALGQGAIVSVVAGNVVTSSGTSFSSPILAGMAAGFWQAHPQLTNVQVIDFLKRSASQYTHPDTLLGYGIPNFVKASTLVDLKQNLNEQSLVFPNPIPNGTNPQVWLGSLAKGKLFVAVLTDVTGRLVWSGTFSNELNTLPIADLSLAPGIYFLNVSSDAGPAFSAKLQKL